MTEFDLDRLRVRLARSGVREVGVLAGGASSLTFRGVLDERPVVVKVAPPGHEPVGHRDVLRQARILRALGSTDVPVPEVLVEDAGSPPLFVMSLVAGESFEPLFDGDTGLGGTEFDAVPNRYRSAARCLATLHGLSPVELGVGDEPVVDATAEVDRWCATLRTVDQDLVPGWEAVSGELSAGVPAPLGPAVVHGDFRLGNLLAVRSEVTAVIDWEIWSVGDPRIDLGWFLANADPATYSRPSSFVDAVPSRGDLLEHYTLDGADVPDVAWFIALACFKSVATWSLIVKHNRRRPTPRAEFEEMAPVLPRLLQRARTLLA
ncbi:phosphotransferase family protein [Mycolicibacterium lacusdiani]|uniref:phosphotransferase family protein n=1 Tax=Mycolicibacterium lacusdiani TaxID=2895283 RepID=UPI001F1EA974|nr:phosphotransferase family protein [Mycolicibacterium lacusdiani]